jgi:NitT/TauT family transport system permease protein
MSAPTRTLPRDSEQQTSARARRRSAARRRSLFVRLAQVAIAVVGIGAWEILVRADVMDEFFFPRPSDIAEQIGDWVAEGDIFDHLLITLTEALLALVIGSVLGLVVGFVLARWQLLAEIFDPYIKMLNSLPRVVLAPIFLLWFGLGIWSKVVFGVTLVFFIVFFNTYQGVREVSAVLVNNARILGAREGQMLRHVFLPSALTWIFSSLHVSVGFAIVGAVVGEYLGASEGMGYLISEAEGVFDTTGVFAGMVVLAAVVLVIDLVVHRVERFLLRWKPDGAI